MNRTEKFELVSRTTDGGFLIVNPWLTRDEAGMILEASGERVGFMHPPVAPGGCVGVDGEYHPSAGETDGEDAVGSLDCPGMYLRPLNCHENLAVFLNHDEERPVYAPGRSEDEFYPKRVFTRFAVPGEGKLVDCGEGEVSVKYPSAMRNSHFPRVAFWSWEEWQWKTAGRV